jgi:hypothetical protein
VEVVFVEKEDELESDDEDCVLFAEDDSDEKPCNHAPTEAVPRIIMMKKAMAVLESPALDFALCTGRKSGMKRLRILSLHDFGKIFREHHPGIRFRGLLRNPKDLEYLFIGQ